MLYGLDREMKMAEIAKCKLTNTEKQFKSKIEGSSGKAGPSKRKPSVENNSLH